MRDSSSVPGILSFRSQIRICKSTSSLKLASSGNGAVAFVDSGFCLLSETSIRKYFSRAEKKQLLAVFLHRQHDFAEVLATFEIPLGGARFRQGKAFADHDLKLFLLDELQNLVELFEIFRLCLEII